MDRKTNALTFVKDLPCADLATLWSNHFVDADDNLIPALPVSEFWDREKETMMKYGTKVDLTLDELREWETTCEVKNGYRGKKNEAWKSKVVEKILNCVGTTTEEKTENFAKKNQLWLELRPCFAKNNVVIVDVDGLNSKGDIQINDVFEMDVFPKELIECPFTLSRNNALPHFFFECPDLPANVKEHYSFKGKNNNALKVFKDFDADLLFNHAWELHGSQVYNYNGELKKINWEKLQSWFSPKLNNYNSILKKKGAVQLVITEDENATTDAEEVSISSNVSRTTTNRVDNVVSPKDNKAITMLRNLQKCWKSDRLNNYDNWRDFTCVVINKLGDDGKEIWDEISKKYSGYDFNKNSRAWDELKKSAKKEGKKLGWKRLRDWAKEDNPTLFEELFPYLRIDWERLTDYTFAKMMVELYFKDKVVFTGQGKDLEGYYYNGIYWRQIGLSNAEISKGYFTQLYDYLTQRFNSVADHFEEGTQLVIKQSIRSLDNATTRSNVIKVLKQENYKADVKWNENRNLFAFEDCVFDLEKGEFVEPSPEQFINLTTGYPLGIERNYPVEWKDIEEFVGGIVETAEVKTYLLRTMATFCKQMNAEEVCYFWLGKQGRNGKGTLAELLRMALGNYFGTMSMDYWTNYSKGENAPNANLANLRYARCINTSEVGEQDDGTPQKILVDKFKRITGGDLITCRNLYSTEQIEYQAGKCLIQTNIMPMLVGIERPENYSLKERPNIIEFPFTFVSKEDLDPNNPSLKLKNKTLKEKFQQDNYKRAFILLLFKYYVDAIKADGLVPPEPVRRAKMNYLDGSNKILHWFNNVIEKGENSDRIIGDELYNSACQYIPQLKKTNLFKAIEQITGKSVANGGWGVSSPQGRFRLNGYKWKDGSDDAVLG